MMLVVLLPSWITIGYLTASRFSRVGLRAQVTNEIFTLGLPLDKVQSEHD